MLFVVLILVLAAFGLLVASLVLTVTWLAWASLGVSVLAALGLVLDWVLRRGRERRASAARVGGEPVESTGTGGDREGSAAQAPEREAAPGGTVRQRVPGRDEEPGEEETGAADALVVSESDVEVRVVDERPRYHLTRCRWLDRRPTLPLPAREARELGFTPCAVCEPDAQIARDSRARA